MKRILAFFVAAAVIFSCLVLTSCATGATNKVKTEKTDDGKFSYIVKDKNVQITKYEGQETEVEIPASIDEKPVVSLANDIFGGTKVTKVVIPTTVTEILPYAFSGCETIETVESRSDIFVVSDGALLNSAKTKLLYYPAGREADIFVIPQTVSEIANAALSDCKKIKAFEVSEEHGSFSAEDGVLFNKNGTILIAYPAGAERTEYTVPEKVAEINMWAFQGAVNLKKVTLSAGNITKIDYGTFASCASLEKLTVNGSNIKTVGDFAFLGCSENLVICAPNGSELEKYANAQKIAFEENK